MSKVFIIAEAGVNHNGSIELAQKMVDAAIDMGADIVKFQTYVPERLVTRNAPLADYQRKNQDEDSQFAMLKKLSLSFDEFRSLADYCSKRGVPFMSTPFDEMSVEFLHSLGMNCWKIPSGEITNYPYLKKIASFGEKVIMSTGMSTIDEVSDAVALLREFGTDDITLLHCTTEYPAPIDSVNLYAMDALREKFNVNVGYSDHTADIFTATLAAARGASVIEKHFTLDKNLPGPDHKASLTPSEFSDMVKSIRKVETVLGSVIKEPCTAELSNRSVARKSIVADLDISKGEIFTEKNLTTKRPGLGINPMKWNSLIGKTAKRSYKSDERIDESELEE